MKTNWSLLAALMLLNPAAAFADEAVEETVQEDDLLVMSVTATREAREVKEVPAAVTVIDETRINDARMFNITDALSGTPGVLLNSKNGGYDARLIIRGGGLKANYGIREVMMLRDGVPMTDPDSFTRLDFIDTQDIEQVEVFKGPGSIYAIGSAGGTIQIISKSVFETDNVAKIGLGDFGTQNYHFRVGDTFGQEEDQALSLTFSHRRSDNDWRDWNEFDSSQVSLKYGAELTAASLLEMELSYTESNLQLPGSMNAAQFLTFQETQVQTDNNSAFEHSGRYSENLFFNSRLEQEWGNFTFKPRVYLNVWSHYHPVTGGINDTSGVTIMGTDLEFAYAHTLLGDANLVAGVTLKQDRNDDDKKYKYRDLQTTPRGRIIATLSDQRGDLLESSDETNTVVGFFAQESLRPAKDWLVDIGFRLDSIRLDSTINEIEAYDYARGQYVAGAGIIDRQRTFTLFSPSIGVSYRLNPQANLYATVAQGEQVPFGSELESNPDLSSSSSRNHEIGIKGRGEAWQLESALYYTLVTDEIIGALENGRTVFKNAGETEKQGFEFAGSARLFKDNTAGEFWLGFNYGYSDYQYKTFTEVQRGRLIDYSGNQLPFIPQHQYSFSATYQHLVGLRVRLQADTWGEYELDNRNSETYEGYDLITSLNIDLERGAHSVGLNIQNLMDEAYAVEVKKDTRGNLSYTAGAPRSFLLSYAYRF